MWIILASENVSGSDVFHPCMEALKSWNMILCDIFPAAVIMEVRVDVEVPKGQSR